MLFVGQSPAVATETLIAAGDQHACRGEGDDLTASLVESLPGTVVAVGDMATNFGYAEEYECYTPTWGRFMDRTYAVAGNHDYEGTAGAPFTEYFAAQLGGSSTPTYYTRTVGDWRIYVLDTNCDYINCDTEVDWLKRKLERFPTTCVAAFFHHPVFTSSGKNGYEQSQRFYGILFRAGADVVVTAHRHNYERFAQMSLEGTDKTGPRQFVVGTGGATNWSDFRTTPSDGSKARIAETLGVLNLTLEADRYDWSFIDTQGQVLDAGSDNCVPASSFTSARRLRK